MKRAIIILFIVILVLFSYSEDTKNKSIMPDKSENIAKVKKDLILYENKFIRVYFTDEGGKIYAYYFKKYRDNITKKNYNIIDSEYETLPVEIEGLPFNINKNKFETDILKNGVKFITNVNGYKIEKSYLFEKDKYFCNVVLKITNNTTRPLQLNDLQIQWGPDIVSDEKSKAMRQRYEGSFYLSEKKVKRHILRKKLNEVLTDFQWMGYHSRYFAAVLIKDSQIVKGQIFKDAKYRIWFSAHFPRTEIQSGETKVFKVKYYVGPQSIFVLKKHGYNLNKMINLGLFGFLTKFFIIFLSFLFKIFHNYGIAIIVITILVKLILLPISNSSIKSMKKMAELQPELQKLQKLYKDNPQKLNEETMKLYKLFKVNPLGGCLPLLVQLPFFWAIYQAFSISIDLRNAFFFWWIKDLSSPDTVARIIGIPINILPILMGIAMFIQQELQGTQQSKSSQAKWMKFMPFLFLLFFWNLPSGLVLYWLTNNILTIFQTMILYKKNE